MPYFISYVSTGGATLLNTFGSMVTEKKPLQWQVDNAVTKLHGNIVMCTTMIYFVEISEEEYEKYHQLI